MTRSRDTSDIFDPNSDIVNSSELNIAINTASAAAVAYTDAELGSIDLSSTIQTASAAAVSYLVDGAPGALNTLNELAAALNDDQNFATSVLTVISSASASTLSAANLYTDNATPDLTPAIQAASAAAVAYTDQEVATAIVTASAAAASYTDSELSSIDLTATIVTASAAAAAYADNLITNLPPLISGISPDNITGTASTAVVINGQNFQSGSIVKLIDTSNTELFTLSTTFNNSRSLQFLTPALTASAGPYDIKVTNPDNQISILENALSLGNSPIWTTVSGSLGQINDGSRSTRTFTVSAYDPDGGVVTYSIISGNLPTGMSISSGGLISGTAQAVASDTTYAFTLRATDDEGSISDRNFSITTMAPIIVIYNTPTSTTWTVPTGVTSIDFLVVGGGGGTGHTNYHNGGAGGGAVVYKQNHSVTPGQSHTVIVGVGGSAGTSAGDNSAQGTNGGNSQFSSYQANGGGAGGRYANTPGASGGCGGGGAASGNAPSQVAGSTNQSLYGDATVYRSNGGNGTNQGGGGGGGAGGNGTSASGVNGANGGPGIGISISGSLVYYGGGGGGSSYEGSAAGNGGIGGGGAGGRSNAAPGVGGNGTNGLGGGAGGSERYVFANGATGGCGTVILRY